MRVGRIAGVVVSAGAVLAAVPSVAVGTQPTAEWRLVKKIEPRYHQGFSYFDSVLALGAKEAFAFGDGNGAEFADKPTSDLLAYRFDGTTWKHTGLPAKLGNRFGPVGAVGPSAVYAMAQFVSYEARPRVDEYSSTLVRWNGTKWTAMKKWRGYHLNAMAVLGRKDIWAFGTRVVKGRFKAVAVHYNGRSWREQAAPYVVRTVVKGPKGRLFATGAKPGPGSWADGDGAVRALRFDGGRWRVLPDSACGGADTLASHRGGPVGTCTRGGDAEAGIFVRWNGQVWEAEKPKVARGWRLGEPVPARDGGLWFAAEKASDESGGLFHRSSSGTWTLTPISPEPLDCGDTSYTSPRDLAALPGTNTLLRAGCVGSGDDGSPRGALARLDLP
ncbi:hypothetical protein GCM10022221_29100 [Actinocorallia aurea]